MKRARSEASGSSSEPADELPPKSQFTAFQPKKYRPQRTSTIISKHKPATEAAAAAPGAISVQDPSQATTQESLPSNSSATSTEGSKLHIASSLKFFPQESQANVVKKLTAGRGAATVFNEDIPDDTTYKTDLEIVSTFDASTIAQPDLFRSIFSADAHLLSLFQRWMETQAVWCYPDQRKNQSFSINKSFASAQSLVASQTSAAADYKQRMTDLVQSVHFVTKMFLNGEVDSFLLHTPAGDGRRARLSASFTTDLESQSSEPVHCCVISSVSMALMRQLQSIMATFDVMVPYPHLLAIPGRDNPDEGFVEVTMESLSSRMLYKVRLTEKMSISLAVDAIIEYVVTQTAESFSDAGSTLPLQVICAKPFTHACMYEARHTLTQKNVAGDSTNPKAISSLLATKNSSIDFSTTHRIALEGFFSVDAIQSLASLLTALAMYSYAKPPNDYRTHISVELEYEDQSCCNPEFFRQRKRSSGGRETSGLVAGSALKNPIQLTISSADESLISGAVVPDGDKVAKVGSTNYEAKKEKRPSQGFTIFARDFVGVPFLSKLNQAQKAKLNAPEQSSLCQGFVFHELSWECMEDKIMTDYSLRTASMKKDRLFAYRICLMKYSIDSAISAVLLGAEEEKLKQKEAEKDESINLDPLNPYSVFAD